MHKLLQLPIRLCYVLVNGYVLSYVNMYMYYRFTK